MVTDKGSVIMRTYPDDGALYPSLRVFTGPNRVSGPPKRLKRVKLLNRLKLLKVAKSG